MRVSSGKILLLVSGAAFLAALFFFGMQFANAGRVARGLKVAGAVIGGTKLEQVEAHFAREAERFAAIPVQIEIPAKKFLITVNARDLGLALDAQKTTAQTVRYGRPSNIAAGMYEQFRAILGNAEVAPVITMQDEQFLTAYTTMLAHAERQAVNANFVFEPQSKSFSVSPSEIGELIPKDKIRTQLLANAETLPDDISITIHLVPEQPLINDVDAWRLVPEAEKLSRQSLTLAALNASWTAESDIIGSWLTIRQDNNTFSVDVHDDIVRDYLLREIVPTVNREPVNAQFTMKGGRVTAFALSKDGIAIDFEATTKNIRNTLFRFESAEGKLTKAKEKHAAILMTEMPAAITTEYIENLGITALIAAGESDFAGSPKNRKHNIGVGASLFNGVLLKPEEEFSFNALLGEVGPEQGYLPELVIKQNKTVPEYGGGLCQVATTAFRAAVLSGLSITERYPHSYIVRYYGTPGFDATIYPPHPDLRFVNDTPDHILIQTRVEGTKLYFEFYGTSDGREVKLIGPTVFDKKPDGSAKAKLTQQVLYNGEVVREKTFNSSYRSPNLYPIDRRNPLE